MSTLSRTIALLAAGLLLCTPASGQFEETINEVMVLTPVDGDVVPLDDLDVEIMSSYGVLTFLDIFVNGAHAVDSETIEARSMGTLMVEADYLKPGENTMQVDSWHQMPGESLRREKYSAPPITFTVKKPVAKPHKHLEINVPLCLFPNAPLCFLPWKIKVEAR